MMQGVETLACISTKIFKHVETHSTLGDGSPTKAWMLRGKYTPICQPIKEIEHESWRFAWQCNQRHATLRHFNCLRTGNLRARIFFAGRSVWDLWRQNNAATQHKRRAAHRKHSQSMVLWLLQKAEFGWNGRFTESVINKSLEFHWVASMFLSNKFYFNSHVLALILANYTGLLCSCGVGSTSRMSLLLSQTQVPGTKPRISHHMRPPHMRPLHMRPPHLRPACKTKWKLHLCPGCRTRRSLHGGTISKTTKRSKAGQ